MFRTGQTRDISDKRKSRVFEHKTVLFNFIPDSGDIYN